MLISLSDVVDCCICGEIDKTVFLSDLWSPSCKECSRFITKRSPRFQSNNSESARCTSKLKKISMRCLHTNKMIGIAVGFLTCFSLFFSLLVTRRSEYEPLTFSFHPDGRHFFGPGPRVRGWRKSVTFRRKKKWEIHILADVCNAQVSATKRVNLLDNNVDWILVFENVDKKIVLITCLKLKNEWQGKHLQKY